MGYSLGDHAHDYIYEECLTWDPDPYAGEDGTKNHWDPDGDGSYIDPHNSEYQSEDYPYFTFDVDAIEKELTEFCSYWDSRIAEAKAASPYAMYGPSIYGIHVTPKGYWHPDTIQMALYLDGSPTLTADEYMERGLRLAIDRALDQKRPKQKQ